MRNLILVSLFLFTGCLQEDTRTYKVISNDGTIHHRMKRVWAGDTSTRFTSPDGKSYVFKGSHSYQEE